MFTFNKSWAANVWKYIGRESTHCCSQCSHTPAHTSPDIQWKLLSVSLDPAEGKSSVGWKGRCGFGKKSACCPPVFESPGSKQPSPRRGANFRVMLHVGAFAGMMNEHILKEAIILKQANIPWSEVKRKDFDKESHPLRHLRSTSRNVHFTGMLSLANDKKKNPKKRLNTNSGTLNRGLFVLCFTLGMKSRDIWWHSWLLLLISVGGI